MTPMLFSVPNFSEGRDEARISSIEGALSAGVTLLDRHSDADHNRAVFTLAGDPDALQNALSAGAQAAIETIDMSAHEGLHPAIGALDVCPVVWIDEGEREAAVAAAREVAARIGALGVPSFSTARWRRRPTGPSGPTSATAASPSSGFGWRAASSARTRAPSSRTAPRARPW